MNEVNIGDLRPDMYWEVVWWCRNTFGIKTLGDKWLIDFDKNSILMSDDYYTLFVLRWS